MNNDEHEPFMKDLESNPLLRNPIRSPLERTVSRYLGRRWVSSWVKDLSDFACHPSAIISDGSFAVFAKFSDANDGYRQFMIELAGLQYLENTAGIRIPNTLGIIPVETGSLFISEALDEIDRTPHDWQQIGRTLAQIHRVKSDIFGFHMSNFFGPLAQDNTTESDWVKFYSERRLLPFLRMAVDRGNIPNLEAAQVEKMIVRLPELCGPEVKPALLHGDAQRNNFLNTPGGIYVIDPAVYYGHPELDLALIDYWQPVPDDVFHGYQEVLPINPGFSERRDLWRAHGYLAAVAVEGHEYLPRLRDAIQGYL